MSAPIRDPNNLRNRWRRKRAAFIAYGWAIGAWSSLPTLRQFAKHYARDAYAAGPIDMRETFADLLARSRPTVTRS